MRAGAAILLLALFVISSAEAKQHCTFRLHTEANAHDSEVFATQLRSPFSGRQVVIEKVPAISEHDVVAFLPYPKGDGTFGALFQLDDHGRLALDTLSVERRGTSLFVFVNARPITELQIDRRISDGKVYVPNGLTSADIALMRKQWRLLGAKNPNSQ
jgi:hypothetical protein